MRQTTAYIKNRVHVRRNAGQYPEPIDLRQLITPINRFRAVTKPLQSRLVILDDWIIHSGS